MWTTLEGIMVASRYELQSHLATGGMAAVFRAWDHRLRRPVALKMLRALADAEPRAVERFRREAKATASLRDPHIVEVYDFFAERGCYYLVMELVEGRNLKDCLAAHGRGYRRASLRSAGRRARPWLRASRHQAAEHPAG